MEISREMGQNPKLENEEEKGEPFREIEYEKFRKSLEEVLQEFDTSTLTEAKKYVDKLSQEENSDEQLFDLSQAIYRLIQLKNLKSWDKMFDQLAQKEVFSLQNAEKKLKIVSEYKEKNASEKDICVYDVGTAVYNLSQAVNNLAEFKYKKELNEQFKGMNEKEIKKSKNELSKFNVR